MQGTQDARYPGGAQQENRAVSARQTPIFIERTEMLAKMLTACLAQVDQLETAVGRLTGPMTSATPDRTPSPPPPNSLDQRLLSLQETLGELHGRLARLSNNLDGVI